MALSELSTQQSVTSKFNEYFSAKNCSSKSANETALMEEFSSLLDAIASQISEIKADNQTTKNNNQSQINKNDFCFQENSDDVKNNQVEKQIKVSEEDEESEEDVKGEEIVLKESDEVVFEDEVSEEDKESEEDVKGEEIVLKGSDEVVFEDEVSEEDKGEEIVFETSNQNIVNVVNNLQPIEKIEEIKVINEDTGTECSEEKVQENQVIFEGADVSVQPQVKEVKSEKVEESQPSNENEETSLELLANDENVEELPEESEINNNTPVSFDNVEIKAEEDKVIEKVSLKGNKANEVSEDNQVSNVDDDKKEVSLLMQILEEKTSEAGEMSEAIVADVVDSQGENFDASASYAQIWQSQYLNEVNSASVTTLINSEKISEEQSAQNMVVQGASGIGFDNNSSSEQIVKEFASSKEAGTLPRSQVTSMMSRVENALKEIARSKDGKTISIKLNPEELGSVKIDVSIRDGKLHARLTAENPSVNQSLREKATELQQILRNSGIEVDEISVSVGSNKESFDDFAQQQAQQEMRQGVLSHGVVKEDSTDNSKLNYTVKSKVSDDHWIA